MSGIPNGGRSSRARPTRGSGISDPEAGLWPESPAADGEVGIPVSNEPAADLGAPAERTPLPDEPAFATEFAPLPDDAPPEAFDGPRLEPFEPSPFEPEPVALAER